LLTRSRSERFSVLPPPPKSRGFRHHEWRDKAQGRNRSGILEREAQCDKGTHGIADQRGLALAGIFEKLQIEVEGSFGFRGVENNPRGVTVAGVIEEQATKTAFGQFRGDSFEIITGAGVATLPFLVVPFRGFDEIADYYRIFRTESTNPIPQSQIEPFVENSMVFN
jgi:hypothetical protein